MSDTEEFFEAALRSLQLFSSGLARKWSIVRQGVELEVWSMTARIFAVLVLVMGKNADKEHPSLYCCTRMSNIAIALMACES